MDLQDGIRTYCLLKFKAQKCQAEGRVVPRRAAWEGLVSVMEGHCSLCDSYRRPLLQPALLVFNTMLAHTDNRTHHLAPEASPLLNPEFPSWNPTALQALQPGPFRIISQRHPAAGQRWIHWTVAHQRPSQTHVTANWSVEFEGLKWSQRAVNKVDQVAPEPHHILQR